MNKRAMILRTASLFAAGALALPVSGQSSTPLLIDGHNDVFIHYMDCKTCPRGLDAYDLNSRTGGDTDIPRLRQGGVNGILINVFSHDQSTKDTLAAFDFLREIAGKYSDSFEVA